MPQQGINFQGFYIPLPGAYYADNVTAAAPTAPPTAPPLIFIGYGYGPKPLTATTYTNAQNLLSALRGGPASGFVPFLASPSPAYAGAQQITFIDASSNTQSALSISGTLGSGAITLTSALYGPPSNLLTLGVTSGSVSGSVTMTITDNYASQAYTGTNLGIPFQLAYLGTASGAGYNAAVANVFTLNGGTGVSGQSFSFATGPGGYSTVSSLVAAINGTGYWVAQALSSTGGQLPSNQLAAVSLACTAATSGGVLTYTGVIAPLNDPLYWINQFVPLANAVASSGATNTSGFLPALIPPTYFSGALGVPPVTSGYANALNYALTQPGWAVFIDSNTTAVQALGAQHAQTASSAPYGQWRRFFTGSSIGDSVTTTILNAESLDSLSTCYVYPGVYRTNTQTGLNQLYGGLYAAAAAAGIACANQIALPLTNKPLTANGVEVALTQSQLSTLQNAGVMCIYTPQQGGLYSNVPTILSDVTTWQVDNNPENTSSQQVACRYWLAYSVVNTLSQFVGSIASTPSEALILQALIKTLNALIYTGSGSNGVLASWNKGSITLTYTGANQVAAISLSATLVGQNKFITCYVPIQQLNLTVTAASVPGA